MKRILFLPLLCLAASAGAQDKVDDPTNPLVGAWALERYVDTSEGGAPILAFGENPRGMFIFTADGQVSISLMRDPAGGAPADADLDPDGCTPDWSCGQSPGGCFISPAPGPVPNRVSRDPAGGAPAHADLDPDGCTPDWYCSYFGTYSYDPTGPSWTTLVTGGNVANYIGTEQRRSFTIDGDRLIISEAYSSRGTQFRAERVLRRVGR